MNLNIPHTHLIARMQAVLRFAPLAVMGIGGLVVLGWMFNIAVLKSVIPGLATMKFNTALCFILSGIALMRLRNGTLRLNLALSIFVALIGILTFIEYSFNWNIGIDQLFIREQVDAAQSVAPGRMSLVTAVCFFLIGTSLLLTALSRYLTLAQSLALGVGFIALLALVGYVYDVQTPYQISALSSITLNTTILFIILSLAIFFAHPEHNLAGVIVANRAGGVLARRLLPAVITVPLVIGLLRLKGQQVGLYSLEFGMAVFVVSNIVAITMLVFWTARSLNRVDSQRSQALDDLRLANESYTVRVQESEAKFFKAFQASPAAISIATLPEGRWIEVNQAHAKMTGYSVEELIGHSPGELGIVDEFARAKIAEAIRIHGFVRDVEIQLYSKSHEIVEVLLSVEQIEVNGQPCALTIQYDITERKRAENRFRALLESAPDAMVIVKESGEIVLVNAQTESFFGYTRDDLIGKSVDMLIPEALRSHHSARRADYNADPHVRKMGIGLV